MAKKVPGPLRGSLFNPLRIGGPDLLNTAVLKSIGKDDKRISRNTLIDILRANSVQYNNDLIDDLQDLSTRTQFASNDVRRIFFQNKLPIPTGDTLRKITGAIKQRKFQKPANNGRETNGLTNTRDISLAALSTAITETSNITRPVLVITRSQLASFLKFLSPGTVVEEEEKVLTFPDTNFKLIASKPINLPLEEMYSSLLTKKDRELLSLLRDAEDPKLQACLTRKDPELLKNPDLANNIKRWMLQHYADDTAEAHPESLDPNNKDGFDRVAWYYHYYYAPIQKMTEKYMAQNSIPKSKIMPWLKNVTKHLGYKIGGIDIEELLASKDEFTPEDIIELSQQLMISVVRPLGIFNPRGVHGECFALSFPSLTEKRTTPGGIEVPVYKIFSLFGEFGAAYAWQDSVIISSELEMNYEVFRHNYKKWWEELQAGAKWPSLSEYPSLIMSWVSMNVYGPISMEEGAKLYKDFLLAEELRHVDTFNFGQSCLPDGFTFGTPGYKTANARNILREDETEIISEFNTVTLNKDLDDLNEKPEEQEEQGLKIIELEGKLGAIEDTPLPEIELLESLVDIIFPRIDKSAEPLDLYLGAQNYEIRLLSQQFFRYETLDKKTWIPFLVENCRDLNAIRSFRTRIKEAGKESRKRRFLTTSERDVKNPSWRSGKKKVLI